MDNQKVNSGKAQTFPNRRTTITPRCGPALLYFKGEVGLTRLTSSSTHPKPGYEGSYRLLQGPSRLRRRSGAFLVRVMDYWKR